MKPVESRNNNVDNDDQESSTNVHLNVGAVHLQANDIDALRRLADAHPELASRLVDQKDRESRREHVSFVVGMITASVVAITVVAVAAVSLIKLGWWQSLLFVAAILAGSHVLRTILTGEWSETSWFGKLIPAAPRNGANKVQPEAEE